MRTTYVLESSTHPAPYYFKEWLAGDWAGVDLPHHMPQRELATATGTTDFNEAAHYDTIAEVVVARTILTQQGYGFYAVREHEHPDSAVKEAMSILTA